MSDTTRNLIDYAAQDDAVNFRAELYAAIHDRVSAHIEAKKQEIAKNLIVPEQSKEQTDTEESRLQPEVEVETEQN